jgi:hypothetical protein
MTFERMCNDVYVARHATLAHGFRSQMDILSIAVAEFLRTLQETCAMVPSSTSKILQWTGILRD